MPRTILAATLSAAVVALSAVALARSPAPGKRPPAAQPAPARDPLADLATLLGTWVADARPDGATGGTTFERGLGGKVIVRRNHAEYPAGKHEDLMVIYPEAGGLRADYFDNEGHVIHYAVTVSAVEHSVVFDSGARPGAPRFRLSYAWKNADAMSVTFAIAAPGSADLKPYLSGTVRRRRPPR